MFEKFERKQPEHFKKIPFESDNYVDFRVPKEFVWVFIGGFIFFLVRKLLGY